MVEQAARVLGHQRRAVERAVVELLALAVPAVVDGDDAEAVAGEQAHPARLDPVGAHAGGKAVDQQHRVARALVDEGEPHAIGIEGLHGRAPGVRSCDAIHPYHLGVPPAIVAAQIANASPRDPHMALPYPSFRQRSRASRRSASACKEFQCMGARPPHDHPHVYLDMGAEGQILCPYCSTLYVHDARLAPDATEPEGCLVRARRPPRPEVQSSSSAHWAHDHGHAVRPDPDCGRRHRRPGPGPGIGTHRPQRRSCWSSATPLRRWAPGSSSGPTACASCSAWASQMRCARSWAVPEAVRVHDGKTARVLADLPLGDWIAARHGAPYWVAHRGDLAAALLAAASADPRIELRAGLCLRLPRRDQGWGGGHEHGR